MTTLSPTYLSQLADVAETYTVADPSLSVLENLATIAHATGVTDVLRFVLTGEGAPPLLQQIIDKMGLDTEDELG